jgi:hypothetical protein
MLLAQGERTRGAYMTCMVMSGSGVTIGLLMLCLAESIRRVLIRVHTGLTGAAATATARMTAAPRIASWKPRHTRATPSASVLLAVQLHNQPSLMQEAMKGRGERS